MFRRIPNKVSIAPDDPTPHPWPDFAPGSEISAFYHRFDRAEGWLGEGWLMIWDRALTRDLVPVHAAHWPGDMRFFGSNGGGTMFGLQSAGGVLHYLSAPDIGAHDDIRFLGRWEVLLDHIARGAVI